MKNLIVVLLVLFSFSAYAVTPYHWDCGTFTIDATDTMVNCPQISTNYIYFTITNTGTSDIYVRQIINSTNLPPGWSFNMCNPNACWGPNVLVDTFLVPASSFVTARFDFHTDTTIGSGVTNVRFDDSSSPTINGATFNLHAVSLGTGIEQYQNNNNSLLLYPNPVINEFTIINSQFTIKDLEIYNSFGEKVFSKRLTSNVQRLTISVADLPSGIYFVKVRGENGEQMGKFVKQ